MCHFKKCYCNVDVWLTYCDLHRVPTNTMQWLLALISDRLFRMEQISDSLFKRLLLIDQCLHFSKSEYICRYRFSKLPTGAVQLPPLLFVRAICNTSNDLTNSCIYVFTIKFRRILFISKVILYKRWRVRAIVSVSKQNRPWSDITCLVLTFDLTWRMVVCQLSVVIGRPSFAVSQSSVVNNLLKSLHL